jgi:hypothetical protein
MAKQNIVALKLFETAREYLMSADILLQHLPPSFKINAPYCFLQRHAIELAIKANIMQIKNINQLNITFLQNDKTKLQNTHSLLKLASGYFQNTATYTLIKIDKKQITELLKMARTIDKIDEHADFFRYPYNKKMRPNPRWSMITDYEYGLAPEITPNNIPYIISDEVGMVSGVKFNHKCFLLQTALSKLIEYFIK